MASGVAAGAQAGAAFGPWGAAIGGVLGGVSDIAADGGGPFIGGASDLATYGTRLDGSGFSVNFSGTQVATPTSTNGPEAIPQQGIGGASQAGVSPLMALGLLALVGAVVFRATRRRKG